MNIQRYLKFNIQNEGLHQDFHENLTNFGTWRSDSPPYRGQISDVKVVLDSERP